MARRARHWDRHHNDHSCSGEGELRVLVDNKDAANEEYETQLGGTKNKSLHYECDPFVLDQKLSEYCLKKTIDRALTCEDTTSCRLKASGFAGSGAGVG